MKTIKTRIIICTVLITILAVVSFFSCENPIALGSKLDIQGPVVNIISPAQRQSVPVQFELEGTIEDFSDIESLYIKAVINNEDFPRQWRYQKGNWEVSSDLGVTWSLLENGLWEGSGKSFTWKIPVDMQIAGRKAAEGEYTFNVQAWDKGGFSDDNSFKAVVLIVDFNPPRVDISYPYIYRGVNAYDYSPLKELHDILDTSDVWKDPAYLGKFLTQEFDLKWQVEDINDVWSVDIRFYNHDTVIDNDPETDLPGNYIYKFYKNLPPPPPSADPLSFIKPNGSVNIPDLAGSAGTYDQDGDLKAPITEKTTVKIVAVCYDVAGNPNQEKTLGYFVYWPKANTPWIVFTEGMKPASEYNGMSTSALEASGTPALTVFPSKYIKATGYQAHGVKKVDYKIYECTITGGNLPNFGTNFPTKIVGSGTKLNPPYSAGMYSTIFSLQFDVPALTGYYVLEATAYSPKDKPSETYRMLFRVNDVTFPEFTEGPFPTASDPLFKVITGSGNFTISGKVLSTSELKTLCMVWINPESEGFKAMSQLSYFRDPAYYGWDEAVKLPVNGTKNEEKNTALYPDKDGHKYPYDENKPNKLWKLALVDKGLDSDTNRRIYTYEKTINISDLNIGIGNRDLISQIFLLRAENENKQATIITYAPQGDTLGPEIKITTVSITNSGKDIICKPSEFVQIPKFVDGDKITINGTWEENSLEVLNATTYFKNYFVVNLNNITLFKSGVVNNPNFVLNQGADKTKGTWEVTTYARTSPTGTEIALAKLGDTLAIDVSSRDIGGNVATTGSSWLIQSDYLQLMRISSEADDGTYAAGRTIEIFLEFNKPVKLTTNNASRLPYLVLSNDARAEYKTGQTSLNSKQIFVYNVVSGANVDTAAGSYLNVKGLGLRTGNPGSYTYTDWNTEEAYNVSSYPFAWSRTAIDKTEEVRITMKAGYNGTTETIDHYYLRTIPSTNNTADNDYKYTLRAGKHIEIDTTPPSIPNVLGQITSNTAKGYYSGGDIYFTVKFSEPVMLGGTMPSFPVRRTNGSSTTGWTSTNSNDVRVNGNSITFKYNIAGGDTTYYNSIMNDLRVGTDNYTGTITDLAGNVLPGNALSSVTEGNRILTGINIETQKPSAPVVRLLSGNVTANDTNVVSNNVSGTIHRGLSTDSNRILSNLYNAQLWLAIEGTGASYKYDAIEYSMDNGSNWIRFPNISNTPIQLERTGNYTITARQIDKAGNITQTPSNAISFNWDPGDLVDRISSPSANGIYTHVSGRNEITLTIYFRKAVALSGTPQITLNALNSANNPITVSKNAVGGAVTSISFTYEIRNGDKTPVGTSLDITSLSGITAWDGSSTGAGVNVSNLIILPSGTPKLDSSKKFTVETGNLTVSAPAFIADADGGTGYNTESNANFHGIRSDDGSYWTTLEIPFNHTINKGSGEISIEQVSGSGENGAYRLPTVLTEAQYNRFKNIADFDTYYEKGTNGYKYSASADTPSSSDTTVKYILKYKYEPRGDLTNPASFNTLVSPTFINAFRQAEGIKVNVNSQAVSIKNNNTLRIRLTGSSAPQVPGATYSVTLPGGLATDSLGNSSGAISFNVVLRGVAKPFVRVRKDQETLGTQTGSASVPRIYTTSQPFLAYARIDCRTPGSEIRYIETTGQTYTTGTNPGTAPSNTNKGNNNWRYDQNNPDDIGDDKWYINANGTTSQQRPGTPGDNSPKYDNSTQKTLGYVVAGNNTPTVTPDITNVQGFRWWIRVRASANVGGTLYNSDNRPMEETALRTVISFQLRNANNAINTTDANMYSILDAGDQIWIRGGDAIGSSSIPGFPFTWEDTMDELSRKRAGIRLMTLVAVSGNTLNNSLWRFVTWDMGATAYVDFLRGIDSASSANIAWQYGPKEWVYQRNGWTAYKNKYPIYAGKHRWCDCGYAQAGRDLMNFSAVISSRPTYTVNNPANGSGWTVNGN
jgi:hypothetical protein